MQMKHMQNNYADRDCLNQCVVYTLCGLRSGLGNEYEELREEVEVASKGDS